MKETVSSSTKFEGMISTLSFTVSSCFIVVLLIFLIVKNCTFFKPFFLNPLNLIFFLGAKQRCRDALMSGAFLYFNDYLFF